MAKRRLTRNLQAEAEQARKRERLETEASQQETLQAAELEIWRRYVEGLGVTGRERIDQLAKQLHASSNIVRSRHRPLTAKPLGKNPFNRPKAVVPIETPRPSDGRAEFIADMVQAGFSRQDALARLKEVSNSPLFCEHANESPSECKCPAYCYCRVHGNCREH